MKLCVHKTIGCILGTCFVLWGVIAGAETASDPTSAQQERREEVLRRWAQRQERVEELRKDAAELSEGDLLKPSHAIESHDHNSHVRERVRSPLYRGLPLIGKYRAFREQHSPYLRWRSYGRYYRTYGPHHDYDLPQYNYYRYYPYRTGLVPWRYRWRF
jgi:hypothetical protein